MGRPKKDKFADLDQEFQNEVAGLNEAQIRQKLSQIALNQVELMVAKGDDQDLAEKKFAAKEAGATYRDGTKLNKLKTEFCHRVLGDQGKDNSGGLERE